MWLYLTARITFQQEDEDTSGTCDWKYHNLCVWGDTLAHYYSDSRTDCGSDWNPYKTTVVLIYVHNIIESPLYMMHLHVREHACLHVDTDTCVCVLLFVCVMNWCTLEKMKHHSYPLSQHEPNDNKHFKRTKCLSLLECFCSTFTTRCRCNTAWFRATPAVWCFCFIQIYILLWHWYNHWHVWTVCYRCFISPDVWHLCLVYMHYWPKVWNNYFF